MQKEELSPEQSFRLIQEMIEKTRVRFSNQSIYFLLWGWSTFLALTAQYILKAVLNSPYHYHVWWISIVCLLITMVIGRRDKLKSNSRTYVGESMQNLWSGMTVSFFLLCLIFIKLGWHNCYPFFIALYGLGTFVSGRILRFTPFVIGGIVAWVLSALSVWFSMDAQMLFGAAAILFSYIIPGHLLRMKYESNK